MLKVFDVWVSGTSTAETSVDIDLRTRQYIPEDSELHSCRCENLKSHIQPLMLSADGKGDPELSHITQNSQVTVQWLLKNYEAADDVSLPQSTLYAHYLKHCSENESCAVNTPLFGKLMTSVFP
jgi:hypothetical protein